MKEMNNYMNNGNLNDQHNRDGQEGTANLDTADGPDGAVYISDEHRSSWRSFQLSDIMSAGCFLRSAFAFAKGEAERAFAWDDCWDDADDD